jgi:N-acetyl-anhydromuramyl-L-alanine amidase AmpD
MKKITHIIVHCSDSETGNAFIIDGWHKARGWRGIGYHYVILRDGTVEAGRPLDDDEWIAGNEVGAHCLGLNECSVGICLIGKKKFTMKQLEAVAFLIFRLMCAHDIPVKRVLGHYETASGKAEGKTCPNFDMDKLRALIDFDVKEPPLVDDKFNFV